MATKSISIGGGTVVPVDSALADGSTNAITNNAVFDQATKQATLVSGTNIKTVNGTSLLGSGNVTVSGSGMAGIFSVTDYGATGNGSTDDTTAFRNCFAAAIAANGKVWIPNPATHYKITDTINVIPTSGAEAFVDVEGQGTMRTQIVFTNTAGTTRPVFFIRGLRHSTWTGVKIRITDGSNSIIGFDLDTANPSASTSQLTFTNCSVYMGNGTNNRGWRTGHVSDFGADISDLSWHNCIAYGGGNSSTAITGQIGWHNEGSNTLGNTWLNCFGAYLSRMYSNVSGSGATSAGNGAVYFYGMVSSQNEIDFGFGNSQSYLISGGRFESGRQFLNVTGGQDAPAIVLQACQIQDFRPPSAFPYNGALIFIDRPCSFTSYGVNYLGGATYGQYTGNMIRCFGGPVGTNKGTLIIDGGSVDGNATNFYSVNNNDVQWNVYVRGVGKMSGVNRVSMYTDKTGTP